MLTVLILMSSVQLRAEPPQLSAVPGQPYVVDFSGGRRATFKMPSVVSPIHTFRVKVVDNTCTARQNMTCTYSFQIRHIFLSLVWTQHPDPRKLGQLVAQRTYGEVFAQSNPVALANLPVRTGPGLAPDLAPQILECEDFSWLPEGTREAPPEVSVLRLDGEDTEVNRELRINESRATGGAYGVRLERRNARSLVVAHAQAVSGTVRNGAPLMIQPQISWTFVTKAGDTCQVGFSSSANTELRDAFGNLTYEPGQLTTRPAVIFGREPLLTLPQLMNSPANLLSSDEGTYE